MEKKKPCARCGKPVDRHSTICRQCYLDEVKKDEETLRVSRNASHQEWVDNNRERAREISREAKQKYRNAHPEQYLDDQREHRQKVRLEILLLLGGAFCVRCGFDDVRALQIDHVHGNGNHDT